MERRAKPAAREWTASREIRAGDGERSSVELHREVAEGIPCLGARPSDSRQPGSEGG